VDKIGGEMIEILNSLRNYIWSALAFVAGLVTKHLFDLYRNKISKLQYSISKSFLGASGHDNYFGNVQILYNNNPVQNLFLCTITLVNTSNKDFNNLEITVWSEVDSLILVSHANKSNSINPLSLTQSYIQECQNITDQNVKLVWSRRPYLIPVLNRDDSVTFSCLVTNPNKTEPNIYLNCEHSGLKIEPTFVKPQLFWGENQGIAALYGLFVTAIGSIFIANCIESKAIVTLIVFLMAAFLLIPGVITLKIVKRIRKMIR